MKIDREKVIKGIESCEPSISKRVCKNCPYREEMNCDYVLWNEALVLLKEQETVKPYIDIDEAKCPDCKVKLTRQELLGEDVLFEDFYDYCPRCGRKVKWE
ncbi:MAG: hypothetical protein IKE81_09125 [Clostridia bacterium]|nr:hypothetical protein [Clostridia bacterium]